MQAQEKLMTFQLNGETIEFNISQRGKCTWNMLNIKNRQYKDFQKTVLKNFQATRLF